MQCDGLMQVSIDQLMGLTGNYYLAEMMDCIGVLSCQSEWTFGVSAKLQINYFKIKYRGGTGSVSLSLQRQTQRIAAPFSVGQSP